MLTYSVAKIKIKNRADQSGVTGDILHIENTFVDHQYRRMGIGRHLSQIMANEAERVGVKHIVLIPMDIGTGYVHFEHLVFLRYPRMKISLYRQARVFCQPHDIEAKMPCLNCLIKL